MPENYGHTIGYLTNAKKRIGSCTGYTICNKVDVNGLYCTENEKEMLKGIMESVFYI